MFVVTVKITYCTLSSPAHRLCHSIAKSLPVDTLYTVMPPSPISNGSKGSATQTVDGCLKEGVKERNKGDDDTARCERDG